MRLAAIAAVAAGLVLSGCVATSNGYSYLADTWVGQPEIALVRSWGAPTRIYESGGVRFLEYVDQRIVSTPGTPGTTSTAIYGNYAVTTTTPGTSPSVFTMSCRTTFEINRGQIVSWRWNGNDCRAYPPDAEELCEAGDAACLAAARACLTQNRDPRLVSELDACMRQYGYRADYGDGDGRRFERV